MKDGTAGGFLRVAKKQLFPLRVSESLLNRVGLLQRLPRLWSHGRRGPRCCDQAVRRSLCWASVCPSACLSVALKEAGAGPAAAWAELLLRGTHCWLLSLVTDSRPHALWSTAHLSFFTASMGITMPNQGRSWKSGPKDRVAREWT